MIAVDYSTLNLDRLKRLHAYKRPPSYQLQEGMGNGYYGDPPGYPTYFTRSIYTKYGNSPRTGPQMVIGFEGVNYVVEHSAWFEHDILRGRRTRHDTLLRALWLPLPLDHPRTRSWIQSQYSHFKTCYADSDYAVSNKKDGTYPTVFWPVTSFWLPRAFRDDERFSEEWRQKEKVAVEQANREYIEKVRALAYPENHRAVIHIRIYYPQYEPEIDLIENPPSRTGDWWEVLSERPTPQECPGEFRWGRSQANAHPVNHTWCQVCGWQGEED